MSVSESALTESAKTESALTESNAQIKAGELPAYLDELQTLNNRLEGLRQSYDQAIRLAITPEVAAAMAEIDAHYAPIIKSVDLQINALENIIKAAVIKSGATVRGAYIMCIYKKGRETWNGKGLDGYAVAHPEIKAFKKVGAPSAEFRQIAKKAE